HRDLPAIVMLFIVVSSPGAHSLHYNLTVRCQSGSVLSRFFAQGRLDDQPFLSYDSKRGSVVPCALWAETVLEPETWDTETQDLAESGKNLRVTLAHINFLKEEKGGSHSLQESWGCEIREDNPTRGFWNFYYNGEPFLSYHPETRSWTVQPSSAQILAMKVKNSWDADGIQSKAQWAHVQGTVSLSSSTQNVTSLLSGTALLLRSRWPTILAAVVGAVFFFFWFLWCKERGTTSAAEGPGEKSGHWLEIAGPVLAVASLMPPTAQRALEVTRLLEWRGMEVCVFVK
uniref:MHC class I-like antigen recognition-like domain-containing protein n=1 Tax=Spermophilus dauricus TaxID=99837 RepID=A0A8C9ULE2_SPEDA